MKLSINESTAQVAITFETQDEIDKVFALLNHTDITDALDIDCDDGNPIPESMTKDYHQYHFKLNQIIDV